MLARLNVRNKLLVILLPLLVGVGVLSAIGVQDRLADRDDARQDQELVAAARGAAELVHRLQFERLDAVTRRIGADPKLGDTRTATDEAGKALAESLAGIADVDLQLDGRSIEKVADSITRRLEGLRDVRSTVDGGSITATGADAQYSSVIQAVLDTSRQLMAAGAGGERAGASARWLTSLTEADAHSGSLAIIVSNATRVGELDDSATVVADLEGQRRESTSWLGVFLADTDQEGRTLYDGLVADDTYVGSQGVFTELDVANLSAGLEIDPITLVTATVDRTQVLWGAQQRLMDSEIAAAAAQVDALERQVRLYVGGSIAALLLGLLLAAVVTRLITSSLNRLTRAAKTISDESLPRLVESLRRPEVELGLQPTPIDVKGDDEFGQLARAFGAVEQTAIDVAAEQAATLRKGIGDIFVNLARRNQSLLDRQIEFIDRLEANEEDPDQLENLFKLDHLATRMRRNAESLLVLAGAEAPRRRGREVSMTDVIRVAVGEVEDFARVTLLAVDDAMAVGGAAVDIAHLLSELMENGTQYSPPDRRVEVVGHRSKNGGYVISVTDHGVGMSEDARASANELLASPPAVGLALSRSLGFVVASTLAARHGINIRLTESPSGGVTAVVTLPPEVVVAPPEGDGLHPLGVIDADVPAVPVDPSSAVPAGHGVSDDWMDGLPPLFGRGDGAAAPIEAELVDGGPSAEAPIYQAFPEPAPKPELAEPAAPEHPVGATGVEDRGMFGDVVRPQDLDRPAVLGSLDTGRDAADDVAEHDHSQPTDEPVGTGRPGEWSPPVPEIGASGGHPGGPQREAPMSLRDLGTAFEAGLYSLLDDERGQGEAAPHAAPAAPEHTEPLAPAAPVDHAEPEEGDASDERDETPALPSPRRTTMWSAPPPGGSRPAADRPVLPPLPGIPTPGSLPTSIPPSISADLAPGVPEPTHAPAPEGAPSPLPQRQPAEPVAAPVGAAAAPAAPTSPPPLPKRRVATAQVSFPAAGEARIGAPNRPADEIRSILSAYRSGLSSGRAEVAEADQPAPPSHDGGADHPTDPTSDHQ